MYISGFEDCARGQQVVVFVAFFDRVRGVKLDIDTGQPCCGRGQPCQIERAGDFLCAARFNGRDGELRQGVCTGFSRRPVKDLGNAGVVRSVAEVLYEHLEGRGITRRGAKVNACFDSCQVGQDHDGCACDIVAAVCLA